MQPNNVLVISVLGAQKPTLANIFTRLSHDCGCNIIKSRMTTFGNEFVLMLMVGGHWNAIAKLEGMIPPLSKKHNLQATLKRTSLENENDQAVIPYTIEVITTDRPGILKTITDFFDERFIDFEEIVGQTHFSARGNKMVSIRFFLQLHDDVHIASLREEFLSYCENHNLDASLEPIRND